MSESSTMPPDDALPHGTASNRIAERLRDRILSGDLKPGARVRQEVIAAEFGASRIPVRGALRILEADGLITIKANSGAWVSQFSLAECEEIYRIRELIEPMLVQLSRPNLRPEDLDRLDQLCTLMEREGDTRAFVRLDREFHDLTFSGAETIVLAEIEQRLWNMTQPYRLAFTRLVTMQGLSVIHEEHRMMARALRAGDDEHVALVLNSHIRRTRAQLAEHPEVFDQTRSSRAGT